MPFSTAHFFCFFHGTADLPFSPCRLLTNGERPPLSSNPGTTCLTTIKNHLEKCGKSEKTVPIKNFLKLNPRAGCLNESDAKKLKELEVNYISEGFHSFNSIEQKSLLKLVQFGIELGSKYDMIDIETIWYGRKTVAAELGNQVESKLCEIKSSVKNNHASLSFVSDIWSDGICHNSYLDLTCFYVDKNFKLNHQCIAFK